MKPLQRELLYLNKYSKSCIMISTTAKHDPKFKVLPRRNILSMGMSCFMINDENLLKKTLSFFDGKVDDIFIDIEQKQSLNLFKFAREIVRFSRLITVKPNDTTVESCDFLIRNHLNDDLFKKNIIVIGTGNLAGKMANRLAERQANVYILGRSTEKENRAIEALNLFLPKHTSKIQSIGHFKSKGKVDVIVSFITGQLKREEDLIPYINSDTFIIDGGINNFDSTFIQQMLTNNIQITRLDTRVALPYQLLFDDDYTKKFFKDVYGESNIQGVSVAAGGYIGKKGTVIVDNIKHPIQVIGIADGQGGIKSSEQLSKHDRNKLQKIKKIISTTD